MFKNGIEILKTYHEYMTRIKDSPANKLKCPN
jgi:hypothetical protein